MLLIGPVTAQWYLEELKSLSEELKVNERLTIIPGLAPDDPELLQALKTAYCFVLPSHHEPFGIVALEALDAGLPLIASAVGGLKDFLSDGKNALLFEDGNAAELCDAFGKLESVKDKLIENGRNTAQEYSWHTLAETLTSIYRELL